MSGYVSVFQRAKSTPGVADVGSLLGVAAGPRWRRLKVCPFCQGRGDFSYRQDAFHCWKCGERGSVVDLAALIWGMSPFDAACTLIGVDIAEEKRAYAAAHDGRDPHPTPGRERKPKLVVRAASSPEDDAIADVVRAVRRDMRRASQSLVERYLETRGLPAAFERYVHFCADAPYEVGALWGRGRRLPAMVCVVEADGIETGGLHLTYLRADGRGKADTLGPKEPRKKMWGPQTSAIGKPGGIVLCKPADPNGVLCVAEGVENALSLMHIVGNGAGAFAAGSLDRLQGGLQQNAWGAIDWRTPAPDPQKPAATLRHKGPVLIALDADMAPLLVNKGSRFERAITPDRRAQIAGVLATHWWTAAGASDVRCVTPAPGTDINDFLREQVAA